MDRSQFVNRRDIRANSKAVGDNAQTKRWADKYNQMHLPDANFFKNNRGQDNPSLFPTGLILAQPNSKAFPSTQMDSASLLKLGELFLSEGKQILESPSSQNNPSAFMRGLQLVLIGLFFTGAAAGFVFTETNCGGGGGGGGSSTNTTPVIPPVQTPTVTGPSAVTVAPSLTPKTGDQITIGVMCNSGTTGAATVKTGDGTSVAPDSTVQNGTTTNFIYNAYRFVKNTVLKSIGYCEDNNGKLSKGMSAPDVNIDRTPAVFTAADIAAYASETTLLSVQVTDADGKPSAVSFSFNDGTNDLSGNLIWTQPISMSNTGGNTWQTNYAFSKYEQVTIRYAAGSDVFQETTQVLPNWSDSVAIVAGRAEKDGYSALKNQSLNPPALLDGSEISFGNVLTYVQNAATGASEYIFLYKKEDTNAYGATYTPAGATTAVPISISDLKALIQAHPDELGDIVLLQITTEAGLNASVDSLFLQQTANKAGFKNFLYRLSQR